MHTQKSFYKYVSASVAKTILISKTLRWSSPLLFDDPYDVTRELAEGVEISKMQKSMVSRIIEQVKGSEISNDLNPRAKTLFNLFKIANAQDRLGELQDEFFRSNDLTTSSLGLNELRRIWRLWLPEFRILCLSASCNIPLMWEKYADNYKGVVLEFICPQEFDPPWILARPVLYENRSTLLNMNSWGKLLTLNQEEAVEFLFNESCFTKTTDWEYQKEWRVVSFRREGEKEKYADYGFYPQTLSIVHFGPDISLADQQDILFLLKYDFAHVESIQTSKAFQ